MDDAFKQQMIDMFEHISMPHGMPFDDGRRWCEICQRPRLSCLPGTGRTWKEKSCPECSGLWPEYTMEFVHELQTNEDFEDDFPDMVIN